MDIGKRGGKLNKSCGTGQRLTLYGRRRHDLILTHISNTWGSKQFRQPSSRHSSLYSSHEHVRLRGIVANSHSLPSLSRGCIKRLFQSGLKCLSGLVSDDFVLPNGRRVVSDGSAKAQNGGRPEEQSKSCAFDVDGFHSLLPCDLAPTCVLRPMVCLWCWCVRDYSRRLRGRNVCRRRIRHLHSWRRIQAQHQFRWKNAFIVHL